MVLSNALGYEENTFETVIKIYSDSKLRNANQLALTTDIASVSRGGVGQLQCHPFQRTPRGGRSSGHEQLGGERR